MELCVVQNVSGGNLYKRSLTFVSSTLIEECPQTITQAMEQFG